MGKLSAKDAQPLTCGGCVHYYPTTGKQGECYRFPPVPLAIPAARKAIETPNTPQQGFALLPIRAPVSEKTLACGEFEDAGPDESYGGTD